MGSGGVVLQGTSEGLWGRRQPSPRGQWSRLTPRWRRLRARGSASPSHGPHLQEKVWTAARRMELAGARLGTGRRWKLLHCPGEATGPEPAAEEVTSHPRSPKAAPRDFVLQAPGIRLVSSPASNRPVGTDSAAAGHGPGLPRQPPCPHQVGPEPRPGDPPGRLGLPVHPPLPGLFLRAELMKSCCFSQAPPPTTAGTEQGTEHSLKSRPPQDSFSSERFHGESALPSGC